MLTATTVAYSEEAECPMVRIAPERLPDLNVPRHGHSIFYADGELTVVGGHTTHFVPTPTAEYFADGKWHLMQMAYPHDNGFAVVLRSGEAIIGGGHDEELGVGQTFTLERYNPQAHTFEGFGCLDRRRVLSKATQLADGRVIIAGNHYAGDAIACYDGQSQVQHVKSVVQGRSNPYLLRTADDDVLIIGAYDTRDNRPDTVWADRLKGDAFRVPLLEQWKLVYTDLPFNSDLCATDDNTYLLTVTDENGQLGIVEVRDTCFSLLPTACPLPMEGPYGPIDFKGPIVIDRQHQRGYIIGVNDSLLNRQYIIAVDYSRQPAGVTLYYTDPLPCATDALPILTPDGDLILSGGIVHDNYKPSSVVWLYHFGITKPSVASSAWLWGIVGGAVVVGLMLLLLFLRRRRSHVNVVDEDKNTDEMAENGELVQRLCQLLEERRLYLKSRLRQSEVATELGVSVSSITDSLATQRGITFAQLLAEYRVRYAQKLLTEQPDMKIAAVITESGFTSESTFFRTFKAVTSLSPKKWLAGNGDKTN